MRQRLKSLWRDRSGATAVEFVMVFMMVVFVTIAVFEFGLAWYAYSRAEKATQMGARFAVESNPVAKGFTTYSAISDTYPSGESLTGLADFTVICDNVECKCKTGDTCVVPTGNSDYDAVAFDAIFNKIQTFLWHVQPTNVKIDYSHVGMGFSGRPGPDIVPNVTVRLVDLRYNLLIQNVFVSSDKAFFTMGEFRASLPGEDLCSSGTGC